MQFPRVAIYTRVSTVDQSSDMQQLELEDYARSRGYHQVTWFSDIGSGTSTKSRPKWLELMKQAKQRKFDVVLCWRLDRFSRSLRDLVLSLQDLDTVGVKFISLRDNIDMTTPSGRLMLHIVGAFADFEVQIIRERVKSGLVAAKAKGVRLGRPRSLDRSKIHELKAQGFTLSEIALKVGATKGGVSKTLQKAIL